MSILIKNGQIINSDSSIKGDVFIEKDYISQVKDRIDSVSEEIIDVTGMLVLPGGIDPHVHMDLPSPVGNSSDNFYTGSKAALAGGTTTIIDFITPNRGESMIEAVEKRLAEAEKSVCDYSFHLSPVEWTKETANEIEYCYKKYGITSFKTYLAYKNAVGIDEEILEKVMREVAKFNGIVTVHCEVGDDIDELRKQFISQGKTSPKYHPLSRPNDTESRAVKAVIELSRKTNCKVYIVHVSASESVELIREAKQNGVKIFAETCPHYLILDDSVYNNEFEESAKFVLSPPIRKSNDQEALWNGIIDGTIDTIGTDHAPFNLKGQKDRGKDDFTKIPNGAGSVEYRLALLYKYGVLEERISIERFIELTTTNSAHIFGLSRNKGTIKEGFDADIVIWNPEKQFEISTSNQFQNCDSNIYKGFYTHGWPEYVIRKGQIVFSKNSFTKDLFVGKYLKRLI